MPEETDTPTLEERIMQATAAGDWNQSRALKHELLNRQRLESVRTDRAAGIETDGDSDSLEQRIMAAQEAGDWDTSRALKHQLVDRQRQEAPAPAASAFPEVEKAEAERTAELEQAVAQAMEAGDWDRSRALKHQLTDRRRAEARRREAMAR